MKNEEKRSGIEHIIGIVENRRLETGTTKTKLTYGICDVSLFTKIVKGSPRKLDKVVIDVLLQRLGIHSRNFEAFLDADEYDMYKKREDIRKLLYDKDAIGARKKIEEFRQLDLSNVERQWAEYFDTHALDMLEEDLEIQLNKTCEAIRLTIPDFRLDKADEYLYSFVELQLAFRIALINYKLGNTDIAVDGYERLFSLHNSVIQSEKTFGQFAQTAYELLKHRMKCKQYKAASDIADIAIKKIFDSNSFKYLPEFYNEKAKADAYIFFEARQWNEKLFEEIYKSSPEYKYYNGIKIVYEKYMTEFDPEKEYDIVNETNIFLVGEVIKQRRKLKNMTQTDLIMKNTGSFRTLDDVRKCDDVYICSEDTISRLENGRTVTSWMVTRELLEKLDLPPERMFDYYISDNYGETVDKMDKYHVYMGSEDYESAYNEIMEIEKKNIYGNYVHNMQYFETKKTLALYGAKKITEKEALHMFKNVLNKTISLERFLSGNNMMLLQNEMLLIIRLLAMQDRMIKKEENIDSGEIVDKIAILNKMIDGYTDISYSYDTCVYQLRTLYEECEGYYANHGDFEKADIYMEKALFYCAKKGDIMKFISLMYDDAWNHVKCGEKTEEYARVLKATFFLAKQVHRMSLTQLVKRFYINNFPEESWEEL